MAKKMKMTSSDFEHKTNALLPFRKFVQRFVRYFLFSLLLIAISLGIGTVGYHYFCPHSTQGPTSVSYWGR